MVAARTASVARHAAGGPTQALARAAGGRAGATAAMARPSAAAPAFATDFGRWTGTVGQSTRAVPQLPVAVAAQTRAFQTTARARSQESWAAKGEIAYPDVKKLAAEPTGEVTLIDVREPDEVAVGMIPSAVNVPLSQFDKAFNPSGGADFQEKFAFPRPEFKAPLVFYCRSGKRSAQAQEIAQRNGWGNSRNYKGSWLDWVANEERK